VRAPVFLLFSSSVRCVIPVVLSRNDRDMFLQGESCRRVWESDEAYVAPFLVYLFDFKKQKDRSVLEAVSGGDAVCYRG